MSVKFIIANSDSGERAYCKAVMKSVDGTLIDADFDLHNSDDQAATVAYAKTTYASYTQKPFIVFPTILQKSSIDLAFDNYPDFPIFHPFVHNTIYTGNAPSSFTYASSLTDYPDKVPPLVTVNGGLSGLADWNTGAGLEFVEPAHIMYLNGSTPVITFPVTSITNQGGGIARVNITNIGSYAGQNWVIHIAGETGLQFHPNGLRNIYGPPSTNYFDIQFNVGTGSSAGTITATIEFTSGAVSAVAAKIHLIMRTRGCSFGEARMIARATASVPARDNTHGYGLIDVTAANAYTGSVPTDDNDTLSSVTELIKTISGASMILTASEIANAKQIELWKDSKLFSSIPMLWNQDFTNTFSTYELGNHSYKIRGVRNSTKTNFSNSVSTALTIISGAIKTKYKKNDFVYVYLNGTIQKLQITTVRVSHTNPSNDSFGLQLNYYRFVTPTGLELVESKVFSSKNHLLSILRGNYFNQDNLDSGNGYLIFNSISAFSSVTWEDLAGLKLGLSVSEISLNLNDSDQSVYKGVDIIDEGGLAVPFNLTGKIIDNCSLAGVTLYTGQTTKAQVRAACKSFDEFTTVWTDGLPIGRV